MKKITMQSIADLAGVSRATVDKVIHNRPGVSDEVREKIRGIILETNYQPVQIRKFARKETQKRMAVIMPKLQDSFFYDMKQGMDEAAARLRADGLKMDYYFCTDFEPQQILSILDYLKDTQIDGIALRGLLNKTIIERVNEFIDRGIPIFTFDADIPSSKRICYIGEDPFRTGQLAASLAVKSLEPGSKIAILTGFNYVTSCANRIKGFTSYLSKHAPTINIAAIEETLSQHVLTYQKTARILRMHPDIDGIWNCACHSEDMAQAVIDAGMKDEVKLFAFLFNSPSYITELVQDGTIDYAILLNPRKMGKLIISSMYENWMSGIAPPGEMISVPIYIGCDVNIDLLSDTTV